MLLKRKNKGSDVNMAVHLLNDAWRDKYDCAVAVTNDSDLSESLKLAKQQNKVIGLIAAHNVNPHRKLKEHADFHRRIKKHHLKNSMMPVTIPNTNIRMPDKWK